MTQVDFYFNAPDRWLYVSRLLRKATGQGKRIGVWCDGKSIDLLNQSLWLLNATDFVTHCLTSEDPHRIQWSSVVLGEDWAALRQVPNLDVYLNLNHAVPPDLNQVLRILELVGSEAEDKDSARARWKHYTHLGFQINRHDLASASAA
jgi:DNA polymerase-3 subunit chi